MKFIYADGGRSKYFKRDNVRDCVTRAIANATGIDYKEVYDRINQLAKAEKISKRKKSKSTARNGVYKQTYKKYIEKELGWEWHSLARIGQTDKAHLNENELPDGVLIVKVSKHLTCVKDKILYDTYDCTRDGDRLVYGYWIKK